MALPRRKFFVTGKLPPHTRLVINGDEWRWCVEGQVVKRAVADVLGYRDCLEERASAGVTDIKVL